MKVGPSPKVSGFGNGASPVSGADSRKVVYFATGAPTEVAEDLKRLCLAQNGISLRVVVPAGFAPQLAVLASLRPEQVLPHEPFSLPVWWLSLWKFLGLSRHAEIICLSARERYRFLKFLALMLRGRVAFSAGNGTHVSCNLGRLLWVGLQRILAAKGPICVVGSASPSCLRRILASLRRRYPGARLHGVLPPSLGSSVAGLCDSFVWADQRMPFTYFRLLPRCLGKGRFQKVVLACTNENFAGLKWLAWCLPLWQIEIYNEHIDAFRGRNVPLLLRHLFWRNGQNQELRRRVHQWRRRNRQLHRKTLPVGVIGSASAFYLKKIVPALRARFPGVRLHALLPPSLDGPASGLFDSATILRPGIFQILLQAGKLGREGRAFQCWVVPCTNEPYCRMKLLACVLPLAQRQIYNEQADGFPARDLWMFYRHFLWRLQDRLPFQIVAGTAGRRIPFRLLHLGLYALRLLPGAMLLFATRLRCRLRKPCGQASGFAKARPRVDLLYLGSRQTGRDSFPQFNFEDGKGSVRPVPIPEGPDRLLQINGAIQASQADFICLLDSQCRMLLPDWLDRLLETFDEHTGQVGPQLMSPGGETLTRGLLIGREGLWQWNGDNAVCWHTRPEWLEVDALPWVCLLVRRRVFSQVGLLAECSEGKGTWADLDFCRRLSAHGLRSICNQSVTAAHPAAIAGSELEQRLVNAEKPC